MMAPLKRHLLALSVAALGAAPVAPALARAQAAQAGGCTNCRTRELTQAERERVERVRKELERAVDRARDRVAELRESSEYRESEGQALRQALIALEQAEARSPELQIALARLEALRVQEQPRFLDDQKLKSAIKDMMRLEQEMTLRQTVATRRPRGWLGVTFSSDRTVDREGRVSFTVDDYPKILSVDTDSPAAAAGVKSGDVLLAMNGRDLVKQGPIPLSELLTPGETVKLRVLRDRRSLELPVRVGYARETRVFVAPRIATPRAEPGAPPPVYAPMPPAAPNVRVVPAAPAEGNWVVTTDGLTMWGTAVFGAQLMTMDRDQRDALGADDGLLVMRVQPNSLADDAGLRGFDVVVRIDGEPASSPDDMRLAIRRAQRAGADSVVVTVVRKDKERKVTLRWR
jgi:PDZ domain